jgi:hypothetical protein
MHSDVNSASRLISILVSSVSTPHITSSKASAPILVEMVSSLMKKSVMMEAISLSMDAHQIVSKSKTTGPANPHMFLVDLTAFTLSQSLWKNFQS